MLSSQSNSDGMYRECDTWGIKLSHGGYVTMRRIRWLLFGVLMSCTALVHAADCSPLLNVERKALLTKKPVNLCSTYQGKVILVVNTASKCGFTYQYEGLEALYRQYKARGLVVLGFPSNDFANQEPANEAEISKFCKSTYGVEFPMFEKTAVAKGTTDPFYQALARQAKEYPSWNFHKYLIDRQGRLVGSFGSRVEPQGPELTRAIEKLL